METRNKKKAPAKKAPKKGTARRRARQTVASRVDDLLELQRRNVGRYATVAASAVDRIAAGDFNIPRWANDYSTIWSDIAEDLSKTTKALLPAPSANRGKGKGVKRSSRSSEDTFRNWLSLQQSFVSRMANYYRGIGKLIAAGSGEPREWIGGGADFWSDVLSDVNDWAHRESGEVLRPTAEWLPRLQQAVRQGKLAATVAFTVPIEAFSDDAGPDTRISLFTNGLIRMGGGVTLRPPQNVELSPSTVTRSSPSSELKLFDLPASLVPGDVYAGLVWAKETKFPVASIEVQIV